MTSSSGPCPGAYLILAIDASRLNVPSVAALTREVLEAGGAKEEVTEALGATQFAEGEGYCGPNGHLRWPRFELSLSLP